MDKKQLGILGAVVLVCVAALYLGLRRAPNNEDAPEGTWWACTSKACGNEFNLSIRALGDYRAKHYGEPVKCPKCQQEARQAQKCAGCGKLYAAERRSNKCTHCGRENT